MMKKSLIKNGQVWTGGAFRNVDLLISDGRIDAIQKSGIAPQDF